MNNKLWYNKPAEIFEEALPLGNGKFGGMIYGGTSHEKISLNHDEFWSGYPQIKDIENAKEYVDLARSLIDQGELYEAQKVLGENVLSKSTEAFMALGNLFIDWNFDESLAKNYKRELDLSNAVHSVIFDYENSQIKSESFCSAIDNCMVLNRTSTCANLNAKISFDSYHPTEYDIKQNKFVVEGYAPSVSSPSHYSFLEKPVVYDPKESNRSVEYRMEIHIDTDGTINSNENEMSIENAKYITMYLKIATSFIDFETFPKEIKKEELLYTQDFNYDLFKERHIEDYQSLYNRLSLDIDGEDFSNYNTLERITGQNETHNDNGLAVLLFNYGRYLYLSCSRKGSKPINLQGIWNEDEQPKWSSNFTLNINFEMNYWGAEAANLSECHEPMLNYIADLSKKGTGTAKTNYHCRGWCAHHNSDLWCTSTAVGKEESKFETAKYAFWPMASGWLAYHIWEHYKFTMNKEFLKKNYPILKGAALFALDWTNNPTSTIYPSASPENSFMHNNQESSITKNCAMDIGIINNAYKICIETEEILGINEIKDELQVALEKLPKYQIGSKGQLLEWGEDHKEAEPDHRHISLLYDLYPACGITKSDKELFAASRKILEMRGPKSTGWGLAWRLNSWARLQDGDKTLDAINQMLHYVDPRAGKYEGGVYPNLFDSHPPFQIDGNFGYVAGICESLLQSQTDEIIILPALPAQWTKGSVKGLKARGNHEVDIDFSESKMDKVTIRFGSNGTFNIRYKENVVSVSAKNGDIIELDFDLNKK